MTNCPNCGAVKDPSESCCPYCDTPYQPAIVQEDQNVLAAKITRYMAAAIMTPNEARALMGLPPR